MKTRGLKKEIPPTASVEHLLREAAAWQPDTPMPDDLVRRALKRSPRGWAIPMARTGAVGLAFAALLVVAVRVSPSYLTSAPSLPRQGSGAQQVALSAQTVVRDTVPVQKVSEASSFLPVQPTKKVTLAAARLPYSPAASRKKMDRVTSERIARLVRIRPIAQLAPLPVVSRPLPADAIPLDDAPPVIVPVVLAEATDNGNEITMTPGAMSLSAPSASPAPGTLVAEE